MARARDWLVAGALLLVSRRKHRAAPAGEPEPPRILPVQPPDRHAETAVLVLLLLGAALAVAFVAVYALDRLPRQTQLLGATLGLALACVAAALVVTGKRLVPTEEREEDYPAPEHPYDQERIEQLVEESGDRLTRRRLFKLGLGAAGGALGVALVTPALSLGPALDMNRLVGTPWRRGRRLVDGEGKPLRADAIERDALYTAYPEGADREDIGSPLVVVRLAERELSLPPELARYPAAGIVAYSKICTHAGCAISLYRAPLFQPDEPRPALVCPCHYSTFDPAKGGDVLFGPAGRRLPMLPLAIDRKGELRAAGNFDGPVGPSWWGVRMRKPKP